MLLNFYEYYTKKLEMKSIPISIYFDVATMCPLRCPLCLTGRRDRSQTKTTVNFEKFKIIFDKFKDYIFCIKLFNWGEPFLCKDIFKIVNYCHEKNVGVQIHSNLNYYNEKILENIVKSKVDYLHVSIDGFTQEGYEYYRVGGDIKKAFYGLERIIEHKKKYESRYPIIHWEYLINNKNYGEVNKAYKYSKEIDVDIFEVSNLSLFVDEFGEASSAESYDKYLSEIADKDSCVSRTLHFKNKSCLFLWKNLVISPLGSYSPCCIIYKDSDTFGTIDSDKPLRDIINSDIFIDSRKIFKDKNHKPTLSEACKSCTWFKR